jgi:hypothetical protein
VVVKVVRRLAWKLEVSSRVLHAVRVFLPNFLSASFFLHMTHAYDGNVLRHLSLLARSPSVPCLYASARLPAKIKASSIIQLTMTTFPPMPLLPITSPSTISACHNLPLRPSDIFICSYPKSGTTWTQHIVLSLLLADRRYRTRTASVNSYSGSDDDIEDDLPYNHVSNYAPFFESDAHWQSPSPNRSSNKTMLLADSVQMNHDRLGRRVFNTHLRWGMLPKRREVASNSSTQQKDDNDDDNARSSDNNNNNIYKERPQCGKFIYITRNQIDVVASFYHHRSSKKDGRYNTDTFERFVQDWMEGKLPYGSSLDHLIGYAAGFADNLYDTTSSSSHGHDDFGDGSSSSYDDGGDGGDDTSNQGRPLLLLSYEKMKSNLHNEVFRIMSFLNLTHIPLDVLNEEILPSFDFDSMKKNIDKFQPKWVGWLDGFQFLRRGVTGDGMRLMLNSPSGDGESSELMDAYNEWVEREEYCYQISNMLQGDCYEDCREVFLSVVEMK